MGLYVKSSQPLNVFANLVNSNRGAGVAVLQSGQLTRLVNNCILGNGRGGVAVEKDCRVELRGNGVYKNGGHGVAFCGNGQIVENDVVGNRGYGIQASGSADVKVRGTRGPFQHRVIITIQKNTSPLHIYTLPILPTRCCATVSNQHTAVALPCSAR